MSGLPGGFTGERQDLRGNFAEMTPPNNAKKEENLEITLKGAFDGGSQEEVGWRLMTSAYRGRLFLWLQIHNYRTGIVT